MSSLLTFFILAHGGYPQAYQIVEIPTRQGELLASINTGLLLSADDGASWQWVCEEAIGSGENLVPTWWVTPQGRFLGGNFRGLFISSDRGCTWTAHPEFDFPPDGGPRTGVSDVFGNDSTLFATSGTYGVLNRVWRSANEGTDWTPLSVTSTTEFYSSVRTAPSRPQRVYVAAWWFRPDYTEALYVSDDNGDSFSRIDVTQQMPIVEIRDGGMGLGRGSFYVYAVDPLNPDVLWAVLNQNESPGHSFLLESRDQGQTWTSRLDNKSQLTGIVVSADGKTVTASSNRLYRSVDGGAFTLLDRPRQFACASVFGDRFYACGWSEVDGFVAAREDAGTLEPILTWPRVNSVAACPATSEVKKQCEAFFPALVAGFPKPFDPDGGAGGGGGGGSGTGGGGGGDMPPRGCSCSLSGAEVSLTLLVLVGRFASVHALRRRRVHR